MVKLVPGTWVVIADGEKALVTENTTAGWSPKLKVISIEQQDPGAVQPRPTDRPGRRADGGPNQKSAVEEDTWRTHARALFAQDLAELLNREEQKGAFSDLVLIASPQVLGLLRRGLHDNVRSTIVAEIDKTLTNHPLDKIEKVLADYTP